MDKQTRERLRQQAGKPAAPGPGEPAVQNRGAVPAVPAPSKPGKPARPNAAPSKKKPRVVPPHKVSNAFEGVKIGKREKTPERLPPAPGPDAGRLPHDAHFEARYDAATQTWMGLLTVVGMPPLTERSSGLFRCLGRLDRQYRNAINPQTTAGNVVTPGGTPAPAPDGPPAPA